MIRRAIVLAVAAFALAAAAPDEAAAEFRRADHPFILWNKADLTAIRKRVATQPWAQEALAGLAANRKGLGRQLGELLRYALTGDGQLEAAERKQLLRVLRSPIPRGGAQWLTVLRYDLLYDKLTAEQRAEFEKMARIYIENGVLNNAVFDPKIFNDEANYSRYDAKKYTRTNWLPNIIWPRKVSANLLAAALQDEQLIRRTWGAYGSWKWYFDEYLCDVGFYSEEFSKMGATPGAMLVYCIAVERLGLGELGFGYRGKGGATMLGHVESLLHLGYPAVDTGGERWQIPMVTIGDLRQAGSSQAGNHPSPAFQHSLVVGYMPDGSGGNLSWRAHGAWGGVIRGRHKQWDGYGGFTPKMQIPLWFEICHARRPDVGFGWFLAQMRPPGAKAYTPSLFFGLEPIEAAKVQPPPAPSGVWPQRGLIMLRADESPDYWRSAAPAVCLRTGTNYAHNVNDAFAIVGYYAFRRPILINRQVTPGYATGWSRSIQSHCGVTVDGAEPKFTDATDIRHAFTGAVKFAAARSDAVYPGVSLTRSLFLTREYLLDVTRLAGRTQKLTPHEYTWIAHALGRLRPSNRSGWRKAKLPEKLHALEQMRAFDTGGEGWSVIADQVCVLDDPSKATLPRSWYDRKIGVRLSMLGGRPATVYAGRTPLPLARVREGKTRKVLERPSEVGGVTMLVSSSAPDATFAALWEPFEAGEAPSTLFRPIAQKPEGLAVSIRGPSGSTVNDRAMLRLAGEAGEPLTVEGGGESFTFADHTYVRIAKDKVNVSCGSLTAMKLRVGEAQPRLVINGKPAKVRFDGAFMLYGGVR